MARSLQLAEAMERAPFEISCRDGALHVAGELRMPDAARVWRDLRAVIAGQHERLDIDLRDARVVDGGIMALLVELRLELAERGIASEMVGASDCVRPLVHLYRGDEPPRLPDPIPEVGVLERLGAATAAGARQVAQLVRFAGALAAAAGGALARPATANWGEIAPLAERAGTDGVPIVLLLNFLVGLVMAYQSANQLRLYGANIFVADVVGISITRELAPLMTGIIMSGRSGASFAAEIGSMKVSEEIDALRTLGFSPLRYLVLPRVVALALVAPVLTFLGDVVGVAGGAVVGSASLGIGVRGYLSELRTALVVSDVWTGLVKSVAFGIAIALIGCQQGFATAGGAAGVGRRTTSTVVSCLFAIVVIDTMLTVFYRMFGK